MASLQPVSQEHNTTFDIGQGMQIALLLDAKMALSLPVRWIFQSDTLNELKLAAQATSASCSPTA
jgi:hypothetical protein